MMINKNTARAWLEIDLKALRSNAKLLRSLIAQETELIAVVKSDAYGHGAAEIAETLATDGIHNFAVATVDEAVKLRQSGIKDEIIILGVTLEDEFDTLCDYNLTQLAVSFEYAQALSNIGKHIKVHLAVDTGMHRLGFDCDDFTHILKTFSLKNLEITAIATHLASSDSTEPRARHHTQLQIDRFFNLTNRLKTKGYTLKTHLLSSYGLLNYSTAPSDYVRAGILLYGVYSHNGQIPYELSPVLSLKSRIAQVRTISAGETVSYGGDFTAVRTTVIAAVMIGYSDGVPRQISGSGAYFLVRSQKAPILGRICMDLCVIDVTDIPGVSRGDPVTIIGRDGTEMIRCEDFAENCGTITNEILSRLGPRLTRIYV